MLAEDARRRGEAIFYRCYLRNRRLVDVDRDELLIVVNGAACREEEELGGLNFSLRGSEARDMIWGIPRAVLCLGNAINE